MTLPSARIDELLAAGTVPPGYSKLPTGVRCRCVKLWTDGTDHYCCKGAATASPPVKAQAETTLWQRAAMAETVRRVIGILELGDVPLSKAEVTLVDHIKGMPERMTEDFSEAKIGRWLGWVQGVACAQGWLHLDDCKRINKEASDAHAARALPPVKVPAEIEHHVGNEGVEPVAWASEDAMRKLKAGSPTAVEPHFSPKFDVTIPLYASPLPVEPVDHIADAGKMVPVEPVTVDEGMVERAKLLVATEALSKAASAMKSEAYVLRLAGYAPSVAEALEKRSAEAIRAIDAALSTTTAREAPPEPDVEMARHWIDRYAAGIDEEPQMHRILSALHVPGKVGAASKVALDLTDEVARLREALTAMLARFELYAGPNDMHAGYHDLALLTQARAALDHVEGGASDAH